MPVYSYFCRDCGTFDRLRPIADYQKSAQCPTCGANCDRQITTVQLNLMPSNTRTAHRLNEKNAHEPRIRGGTEPIPHQHGPGCSHHGGAHQHSEVHRHVSASRPWQVGH